MQHKLHKDVLGGLLMLVLGIIVTVQGTRYSIGTLSRMGPGYFPVALGVILAACGMVIAAGGWLSSRRGPTIGAAEAPPAVPKLPGHGPVTLEWRAWLLIATSIVAFVLFATYLGLVPATFAVVFISALADRQNNWKNAAVLGLGVVVMAVVVFWWALQVQMPLFRAG
jgi:hypothetical protein